MTMPEQIGGMPVPTQDEIDNAKINQDLEVAEEGGPTRAASAVALRLSGATYSQIAQVLSYSSAHRARKAVERALAESADSQDEHDKLRFLEARRLERLLQSVWPRATNDTDPDHLPYARFALAVIDRHARLHGLDAPQQMVVYNPDAAEINAWVAGMTRQVTGGGAVEAEIIEDAEVVDG